VRATPGERERERERESCLGDTEKRISSDQLLWSFTVEMWGAFR